MVRVTYIDILPGLEEAFWKNLQSGDRFVYSSVRRKTAFLSVKRKAGLTARSMLPQIAAVWELLSDAEKLAWSNAGTECNLNGWRLFVQDQSLRIKNDLPGVAIPSLLHQSLVGVLQIDSPAAELKIIQIHPRFYWVSKSVYGKKGMYEPVKITEDFALPLKISLNYRAELEEVASPSFAKLFARVWHSYQGQDIYTDLEIPLDYVGDWKNAEATLTTLAGYVVRYDLYFHLKNLTGTLYVDNVKAEHSGQNWCRDPFCKDINQGFTRAFYQVPKHWAGVVVPDGSWFESFYIDW